MNTRWTATLVALAVAGPTMTFATGCSDSSSGNDEVGSETDEGIITTSETADDDESSETATTDASSETDTGCDVPCGDECCGDDEVCDEDSQQCVLDCGDDDPCGDDEPVCCGDGEICYVGMCVTPGGPCSPLVCATETESECDEDEICDPDLGECVPNLANERCTFTPEAGVFDPVPRWSWGVRQDRPCAADADCQKQEICDQNTSLCAVTWPHHVPAQDDYPEHHQVMASPMVADLDGDCIPEVIFNSFSTADWQTDGVLRVLHGDTGESVWSLGDPAWRSDGTAIPAIGDVDYDGDLEIVNIGADFRVQLIDHEGTPVWASAEPYAGNQISGAPSLANFDLQGDAEIAYGRAVYDSAGTLLWQGSGGFGTNNAYAVLSCVADLDGDMRPELIGGGTAYTFSGTVGVDFAGSELWNVGGDGYCGVADFDLDGAPEVVIVRQGSIDVADGLTGAVLAQFAIPGGGMGGPPNIADFDGDGFPDIGLAGGARYVVVTYDGVSLTKIWDAVTKDVSSNRTGSSVFDFDGDGRSEVVYGDEWYLRIYPGVEPHCELDPPGPGCDQDMTDAEVLFRDITSSGTRVEYPVIADVDGDFKAEIVVSTNNMFDQGNIGDAGVEVFEDRLDNWVATAAIWNQHSYHITNVEPDGGIPIVELDNWDAADGNSYRRNTQGAIENCAPDLVLEDLETVGMCLTDVTFSVRVCNQGCLGVGPGVDVTFSEAEAGVLGVVETEQAIPAGGCVKVELTIPAPGNAPYDVSASVDDDGMGVGAFNECIEDNNGIGPEEMCISIG